MTNKLGSANPNRYKSAKTININRQHEINKLLNKGKNMNPFEKNSKFKSLGIHKIENPKLNIIQEIIKNKQSSLHKYQILVSAIFGVMLLLNNVVTNRLFSFIFLPAVILLPILIFYFYNQKKQYQIDEGIILKKIDLYNEWKSSKSDEKG